MSTIVDSNVLLDLTDAGNWTAWSQAHIRRAREIGPTLINQIVYSEVSSRFVKHSSFDSTLAAVGILREDLPWDAAYLAGQVHTKYRQSGGLRERTLPDFLIGSHASVRGHSLLTRDARRYRRHFPDLDIIAPDTHP